MPVMVMLFVMVPAFGMQAYAFSSSQPPVPSYSPVSAISETTTVTIPDNLIAQWRGTYTMSTFSVLKKPEVPLRDRIQSVLVQKKNTQHKRAFKFNPKSVYEWTGQIAKSVNATTAEPSMKIEKGRVVEFTPPQTGRALDRYNSTLKIIEELHSGNSTIELVVQTTQPQTKLSSLNNLGIIELIGRGESKFSGSPYNRQHNIKVGMERMKGVIIKPGEEFSFNKYLGPVEKETGFLPELVIKRSGTVPEFGGGLCQVSSTVWRAAMHSGLPITQRKNHSYAVQYYAPQGTDATIYPGVIDLKFVNDTGNSVLVWPHYKASDYIIFDFYGTSDGRTVKLSTPYQYDKKSDGSLKATWSRTVTKKGKEHKETFNSVYQPPALFKKQESFASPPSTTPTPTPSATPSPAVSPTPTQTSSN